MSAGVGRPEGRIVITGIGAVTGWGWNADALWQGLRSGQAAIHPAKNFSTRGQRTEVASEAPPEPPELARSFPGWHRLSRADRFALAAAHEAWSQAGFPLPSADESDPELGIFFGTSTAGIAEGEEYFQRLMGHREGLASLQLLASHEMNGPGDAVARWLRAAGPVRSISSACSAAGLALGDALHALRSGEAKVAVAGGADSLCLLTYSGFNSLRAVDERPSRPFRADRAGLSLGEGAGVLVLERLEDAQARGARPLAELLGAGASCDAYHMTAPHPEGEGAALAIQQALDDAGRAASAVDFVNAHGTGTPLNDSSESGALHEVFGPSAARLPVTSTKASVGHLLGSSGAVEAVATVLCLAAGEVHPTAGGGAPDPELEVDLVWGEPRPLSPPSGQAACALSTSLAFGGANAALVLAGWSEADAAGGEEPKS
ncbi:MAG: beta-ketoacyl-[acyl-carrier-protein] synthase family protein [Acidobacteriota bacterium]|nr:beta-ketoacyl-[acyl-carrier-protein] synthase family protein [Acidobacteriota bacterium]